jgi:hypothetical protein
MRTTTPLGPDSVGTVGGFGVTIPQQCLAVSPVTRASMNPSGHSGMRPASRALERPPAHRARASRGPRERLEVRLHVGVGQSGRAGRANTTSYGATGCRASVAVTLGPSDDLDPVEAERPGVLRDQGRGALVVLDQRDHTGTAGPRLEADRAAAGVQVEEAEALERAAPGLDRREECLAHAVAGRARGLALGRGQPTPADAAPDDARHDGNGPRSRSDRCARSRRQPAGASGASTELRSLASSSAPAASRAWRIVVSSRSTLRFCREERTPDWAWPRTSPSRRCSRSTG